EPDVEIRLGRRSQVHSLLRSFQCFAVPAQFLFAESTLGPRVGITAICVSGLFEIRQRLFAVVFGKKTQTVAEGLNGPSTPISARGSDQLRQTQRRCCL